MAPRSIMAWVNRPGACMGITCSNAWATFRLVAWAAMSLPSPVRRATTRSTLPSTAALGWPKAMEQMAPAV